ncbi:hypothetical protein CBR_g46763 [Chara braunii]|uniref:Uncharacterized protein n=1 Tax=Chara braunii TaxID=69332 RepID=A0A388K438_CHABU|nr:hypothetical protein CBR_g46763 [Chara braunii]|eukprot:GBG64807.1 hypothetical protein CBR_g46763 [Chara braunii]
MSFAIERAFSNQLLMPRGEISAIRQVHHPRTSPDFMRLEQFFCTAGVYGAAEFRFTSNPQVVVLAEATAFQRRAAPRISHVSTVVAFSGDITAFDPARQAAIKSTLYQWGRDLATLWDRRLTRHGDECYPVDGIEFVELSFCLLRVDLNWTWEGDRRPASETVELLIIHAWRTNVAGDLLGFVFGAVDRGNRSRTLAQSLQWSACIEERWADGRFPSRSEYLDVHSLTNPRFFRQPTTFEWAALRAEEEAEEDSEGELRREAGEAAARLAEDEEDEREAEEESAEAEEEEEEEGAEEETSEEEEEAYSEHSEGEPSEEENEDDEEEVESGDDQEPTHDDELEWVTGPDRREENPEAAAQRKKEVVEGKRSAIDPTSNDPSKDPEPPKPEHGDIAATTSSAATTRRRSRSES